jgi:hypothetical protein
VFNAELFGFSFEHHNHPDFRFYTVCIWVTGVFMTLCASFLPATNDDYGDGRHESPGMSFGITIANIFCMYLVLLASSWGFLLVYWASKSTFHSCQVRARQKVNGILEEPLGETHEARLKTISEYDDGRFYALHHLSYFTKPHPSLGIYTLLADANRWWNNSPGPFRGYKKHTMAYYGGVTLIMLLMAISFSSSNRAALAIRGSAQELPIGYFITTKCYGWIPHNASFGFLDLAPSILHSNWFWDYIS